MLCLKCGHVGLTWSALRCWMSLEREVWRAKSGWRVCLMASLSDVRDRLAACSWRMSLSLCFRLSSIAFERMWVRRVKIHSRFSQYLYYLVIGIGGGGHCAPPPQIKTNCRCKNSGKFRAKFWHIPVKHRGNLSVVVFVFVFYCSSIIFARITCRISCTPNPILKYRTDFRHGEKKVHESPPARFSALAGIRQWIQDAGKTEQKCVCPPKMNWSRTPMYLVNSKPG